MKALCNDYSKRHGSSDGLIVVAQSSGNHAQALSLAAQSCGVPAHIVMPHTSPAVKCEAVKGYGGIITLCEPTEQVRGEGRGERDVDTMFCIHCIL